MDSACDLSASVGTCPPRVTTPLSRSWLTETSINPARSSEVRMLSETSGDFVDVPEHPEMRPTTTNVSTCRDTFRVCIFAPQRMRAHHSGVPFRADRRECGGD